MNSPFSFRPVVALVAFFLSLGFEAAFAQTPQPAPGQSSLQVSADEVLLDLVVHDKRNHAVLDLQPSQIAVTDNGAPVELSRLRLVSGRQASEPLITLLFDRPAKQSQEKKQEDDQFGASASADGESSQRLQDAAAKFVKSFPEAGFRFSVMDVWARLQLQQEFTDDRSLVMRAVESAVVPGEYGVKVTSSPVEDRLAKLAQTGEDVTGAAATVRDRATARAIFAAINESTRISQQQHTTTSMASLLALVEAQQSLPGRKAVVYFPSASATSGTGSDTHGKGVLQSIIGAANRAGVNIYVIRAGDPEAAKALSQMLQVYSTMSIASADLKITQPTATSSGINGYQVAVAGQFGDKSAFRSIAAQQSGGNSPQDGLDALAKGTGGVSIDATGNIASQVKDLVGDMTTFYEASYVPPAGEQDGSFHATAVTPLRAGLKVRARTGYLALPPNAGIDEQPQPFELPLMAVLKRQDLPGDVSFRAAVLRMGHQDGDNVNLVAVQVPTGGLQVHEDSSTHLAQAHVSVLATIKDNSGTVIERFSEDIARRWAAVSGEGGRPDAIEFERSFSAPPGEYVLETAIADNNSGKTAANRQNFTIGTTTSLPELSQLVLVRGVEPAEQTDSQPQPLTYGDRRFEPNLYGELPSGTSKVAVFLLAHTDPKLQETATVKLEVLRDGAPLKGAELVTSLQSGTEFHPVLNDFSINGAADGTYQLLATLTQGGKSVETIGDMVLTGEETGGAGKELSDAALVGDPRELAVASQTATKPGDDELSSILADATKNSIDYSQSLPNLICEQKTNRLEDVHGDGIWKRKDTILELLTYVDHQETREQIALEQNNAVKGPNEATNQGMVSAGEFGDALVGIFTPESKAEFKWVETATLRDEAVEVFDYQIAKANSTFSFHAPSGFAKVGYHGRLYIDRATRGVRSVTLITDEAPKGYPIRKAAVRVDYDYVVINDHDYLLPVSAQVVVGEGKQLERNDLEFSNFRRFGSTVRIVGDGSDQKTP